MRLLIHGVVRKVLLSGGGGEGNDGERGCTGSFKRAQNVFRSEGIKRIRK